jgi:hypothetical protein
VEAIDLFKVKSACEPTMYICPICGVSDQVSGTWVECDQCKKWFHQPCVGVEFPVGQKCIWSCSVCQHDDSQKSDTLTGEPDHHSTFKGMMDRMKNFERTVINKQVTHDDDTLKEIHEINVEIENFEKILEKSTQGRQNTESQTKQQNVEDRFLNKDKIIFSSQSNVETHGNENAKSGLSAQTNEFIPQAPPSAFVNNYNVPQNVGTNYNTFQHASPQFHQNNRFVPQMTASVPHYQHMQHYNMNVQNNQARCNDNLNVQNNQAQCNDFAALVKLMKRQQIEALPEFYGDEESWPVFYAQYKATCEEGEFLPHENLRRLSKALKGDARKHVEGKLLLPENVNAIIRDLQELYGNKQRAIKKWIRKLRTMPAPSMENAKSIMAFRVELSNGLVSLKNMEAYSYLDSPTLPDDIIEKFPLYFRRKWYQHVSEVLHLTAGDASLEQFEKWFKKNTQWVLFESGDNKTKQKYQLDKNNKVMVHDLQTLPDNVDASGKNSKSTVENKNTNKTESSKKNCCFCQKYNHSIVECKSFERVALQQRWDFAKKKRLCFCCLSQMHGAECPVKKVCGIDGCERCHHKLLHKQMKPESTPELNATVQNGGTESTFFRIVPVRLFGNGKVVEANAFFDEGSSPTMMTSELASRLGISGPTERLCISWTDNEVKVIEDSKRVNVFVSGIGDGDQKFLLKNVRTIPKCNMDLPKPNRNIEAIKKQCMHLKDLNIAQPFDAKPELLIGLQHPKLGLPKQIREGNWNQPVASETPLGWVIHGKYKLGRKANEVQRSLVVCECNKDDNMQQMITEYFTTDNFGVRPAKKSAEVKEEERAKHILESTTQDVGLRYETGLIWKKDDVILPESKNMAMKRLQCLEKQMAKDKEIADAIKIRIRENLENGFIRRMKNDEASKIGPRTWYLPIFAVRNPHKPGKIRIVYDAAAQVDGISLNSQLLAGPDLLKSIVGVLWRARQGKIAVSGDIKDMFHRILIKQEDQDSQRFLWRDCNENRSPDTYVLNVMSFGAACSPCSAQWIKNHNAYKYQKQYPRAVTSITENHYVDDMFDSFEDEEEAVETAKTVIWIHKQASFEIRNWLSNSSNVMTALNGSPSTVENHELALNMDSDAADKILGLYWNVKKDVFTFKLSFKRVDPAVVASKRIPTKREVLKVVMAVFDPQGYASLVLVHAKILLQEIWRTNLDWDDEITNSLNEKWNQWLNDLKLLERVAVPRCFSVYLPVATHVELHTFVDASEYAFAAVSYLRILSSSGIEVAFVGSKNKVAPKKQLSVPRLELQAAVLGVRLAEMIVSELSIKINSKHFWSDSQTVLAWIGSDHRRYKQFVANRISEILDTTQIKDWKWIPSRKNVADEATKRPKIIDVGPGGRWFAGPEFLKLHEADWPQLEEENKECVEELRTMKVCVTKELANRYGFLDCSRFSKWWRLVRTCGWAFRAINLFKLKKNKNNKIINTRDKNMYKQITELTAEELEEAEMFVLKKAQWESFPEDVHRISNGETVSNDSKLKLLSPYQCASGLIRIKGRIDAVPFLSNEFKRPIILLKEHPVSKLLVQEYHERFCHLNAETIVNEMRQKFWIPGLRTAVRRVINCCQVCKNRKAMPQVPEMCPLPAARLAVFQDPFSYVGLDFFGPLLVTIGRRHEKRYGALFTCLTTRAVHIEMTSSLNTDSCIMAVRNFMCRRGPPKQIWSDNGTNLHGAHAELKRAIEELDVNRLQAEGQSKLPGTEVVDWKFITPRAPHMGGSWERMVRSIKTVLYVCLKEKSPKEEVLRNLLIEAESIVNSRPLTYQPIDPEIGEAITPNHILRMSGKIVSSPGKFDSKEICTKLWRHSQQLAEEFWRRFIREYLPDLTKRTKWYVDQKPVEEGDVVIIVDEDAPRNVWEKGIVTALHAGPDGKVRTATVRTASRVRRRPVAKLAVMDVRK